MLKNFIINIIFFYYRYALSFKESGGISVPLLVTFAVDTDITVELLFKPLTNGTIFSYAYNKTFAITINNTLWVSFGQLFDTGIRMEFGIWYQLSIMWYHRTSLIQLYTITNVGRIQRREFKIDGNPFPPGGTLALGYWEPSSGDTEVRVEYSFVGVIDELRVWNRSFNPVTIQQNWKMNVNPSAPSCLGLWKFNEGSGLTARNLVNNEHIHFPSEIWSPPNWIVSDADIALNLTNIEEPFEIYFANETLHNESKSWCRQLFYRGPLNQHCNNLTLGTLVQFYYLMCLQTIARTNRISSSLSVVVEFSNYCQNSLSLTIWPARTLCNAFGEARFPYWIGHSCNVPCIFGYRDPRDTNRCKCIRGYWGDDCSKVCPGGYIDPCLGHGVCNPTTGKCECEINWRGGVTCTKCGVDWFGERCQYAGLRTFPLNTFSVAAIKGHGYFTTFLGISFYLSSYGEFYLIQSSSSSFYVQVRQSPCMHRSFYRPLCTTAFAFRFGFDLTVTIRAPVASTNIYYPHIWINGKPTRVDHVTRLSATVRMTRIALNRYEITGPEGLLFVVTVGQSLSIRLRIPRSLCTYSTGILGACAQRLSYQNATDILALRNAIANGTVNPSDSLFVYTSETFHETRLVTGAWFHLLITNSHVVSDFLLLSNYKTITMEVFVRIRRYGGTLLAYGHEHFLSVTCEREIRILYGSLVFNTGLQLKLNAWSQITLVWVRSTNVLQFYYHDFKGGFYLRTYRLTAQPFANRGRLYIGQWRAGDATELAPPKSDFRGEIDEIRIWNRLSVPDLVRQNWSMNADASLPGLLHLWKLDRVEGNISVDLVSGKLLHLPLFNKPAWDFSDLPIPSKALVDEPSFKNSSLRSTAEQFCHSVLLSGPLHNNCQLLGPAVAGFYYKICLSDIASTSDISMAIEAVVLYADLCEEALGLSFWPARELCNRFSTQYFPGWIGAKCNTSCIFGTPQSFNGSTACTCADGYWGESCAELCPGGLWNVCGRHGTCDLENGTCECDLRWKGELAANTTSGNKSSGNIQETLAVPCSRCTNGWRGKDCSIAVETSFSNSTFLNQTAICVAFGDPHVTTFSRTNYHLGITGAFTAVRAIQSSIQLLQVPCENSIYCRNIRELAFASRSLNISLRASKTGQIETNVTESATTTTTVAGTLEFTTVWKTVSETRYRWLDRQRLELVDRDGIKTTVLAYFGTLGAAIEIPRNVSTSGQAMCGSSDGVWAKDVYNAFNKSRGNENATEGFLDLFNQRTHDAYVDEKIRIGRLSESTLLTGRAVEYRTGGGYMLSLSYYSYLSAVQDFTYPRLSEFTIEIWVRLSLEHENASGSGRILGRYHRVLFSIAQELDVLTVTYKDQVIVSWGRHTVATSLVMYRSTWTHLSLSWRRNDGKFVLMLSTGSKGRTGKHVHYGIMVNQYFEIHRGFVLGHDGSGNVTNEARTLVLGIDELRVWQFAREGKDILNTMTTKHSGYVEGLVVFCGFDEGRGETSNGTLYFLEEQATTSGYYHRGNESGDVEIIYELKPSGNGPVWEPSGAPFPNVGIYKVSFGTNEFKNSTEVTCFKMFYSGPLYKYCGSKLPTQTLFYYESCLADVKNSHNLEHSKMSVSLFAFYCQKVLAVPFLVFTKASNRVKKSRRTAKGSRGGGDGERKGKAVDVEREE